MHSYQIKEDAKIEKHMENTYSFSMNTKFISKVPDLTETSWYLKIYSFNQE